MTTTTMSSGSGRRSKPKAEKKTAKDIVVDRLIEKIESEHILPWKRSWFSRNLPYNQSTMKRYRGINVLILWALGDKFEDKGYMTYKQAQTLGARVREGEKGFPVLFAQGREVELKDANGNVLLDKDGRFRTKTSWVTRYYTVFNVAQIDGLPEPKKVEASLVSANDIIAATNAKIVDGEPSYSPELDVVRCPSPVCFDTEADYYATIFHELVHWTGATQRLNRDMDNHFGSDDYSKEELIAEIGASFLMAEFGIFSETVDSNAAYVKNWLEVLKGDRTMIINAAAAAQKAVDYIFSLADYHGNA